MAKIKFSVQNQFCNKICHVNKVAGKRSVAKNPTHLHFPASKVLTYLKGTIDKGIRIRKEKDMKLVVFTDSVTRMIVPPPHPESSILAKHQYHGVLRSKKSLTAL